MRYGHGRRDFGVDGDGVVVVFVVEHAGVYVAGLEKGDETLVTWHAAQKIQNLKQN